MCAGVAKNYKWLLPPAVSFDAAAEHAFWRTSHGRNGYDDIFSVTEDEGLRVRIVSELRKSTLIQKILIPACGTRGFLERAVAAAFPDAAIVCVDLPGVAEIASARNANPKITYVAADCTRLTSADEFDAVILINAVVSDDDATNRDLLAACHAALKPGGQLIGLFPTVYSAFDLINSCQNDTLRANFSAVVNAPAYRVKDPVAGTSQIFYGPLLLNHILKEAGFADRKLETYFLDSPFFTAQAEKMYGLSDPDMLIYEYLVTARKEAQPKMRATPSTKSPTSQR